jgi:hypothetical protein
VAGSTAGLGYGSLSDIEAPRGTRRGGGGGGQASGRAGAKLNPDEEIGIKAAKPGEAPTLAHPDGPTEDEQNDMATQDTKRQMGMPTPWRGGGRKKNPQNLAGWDYSRSTATRVAYRRAATDQATPPGSGR